MAMTICACGNDSQQSTTTPEEPTAEPIELIVFAAASTPETLAELGNAYMAENENVTVVFNFDSSGTLKIQIQEGADMDIFISAGQKQMNLLDITASAEVNTDGLDFVLEGTRFDILENRVALAIPEGNPAGSNSCDDLVARLQDGSTMPDHYPVEADGRLASMRIVPQVTQEEQMIKAEQLRRERKLLELRPYRQRKIGVVITGSEVYNGRIKDKFEPAVHKKIGSYPSEIIGVSICDDDLDMIVNAAKAHLDAGAAISMPTTIFDVLLPQIFAGDKLTKAELINFGNGGLCQLCKSCHWPNCTFGRY